MSAFAAVSAIAADVAVVITMYVDAPRALLT
jgi:hypothetical protein